MRGINKLLRTIGQGFKVALGALFVGAILWCVVYRFFLGFTSPWLDEVTIGMSVVILLAAGILKLRDGHASNDARSHVTDPTAGASGERR